MVGQCIILLICLLGVINSQIPVQILNPNPKPPQNQESLKPVVEPANTGVEVHVDKLVDHSNVDHTNANVSKHAENDSEHSVSVSNGPSVNKTLVINNNIPTIEPGADLRLVSVISVIALCALLCVCCKMYRNRKMPKIVKKYGERKRRTDVEMEPLPLDDDEEDDETVFDLGHINSRT